MMTFEITDQSLVFLTDPAEETVVLTRSFSITNNTLPKWTLPGGSGIDVRSSEYIAIAPELEMHTLLAACTLYEYLGVIIEVEEQLLHLTSHERLGGVDHLFHAYFPDLEALCEMTDRSEVCDVTLVRFDQMRAHPFIEDRHVSYSQLVGFIDPIYPEVASIQELTLSRRNRKPH